MNLLIPTRRLLLAAMLMSAPTTHAQTLSEWLAPVDGDWSDPLNWSTPDVPNNGGGTTYDVLISAGGGSPYTVELDNLSIGVDSLALNDSNATLNLIRSDLTAGVLDVMAGSVVTNGSTITGARLIATGGVTPIQWEITLSPFNSPTTTWDNMRVSADVTLSSPDFSGLSIENGLVLDDGVVMRSELLGRLSLGGDITTSGQATLQISGELRMPSGPSSTQIGSGVTIEMLGSDALLENFIDNHGTIRADGVGNTGDIEAVNNFGLIEASNGGLMVLSAVANHHGTIHISAGSTVRIEQGQLNMNAGSQLTGDGTLNLRSGQFYLNGQTIDLDQSDFVMDGGRIYDGTITSASNTPLVFTVNQFSNDPYFSNMTFDTDVHLSGWHVTIEDGLTLTNGAVLQNPGTGGVRIDFADAMTVSGDGRIQFGGDLSAIEMEQSSGAVIFDTGIFIDSLQGDGIIGTKDKDWISRGTIAIGSGHNMTFRGNWSNEGTLVVEDTAELILDGEFETSDFGTVINQGGSVVIAGNLDNTGSVLDLLFVPGHVKVDNGSIIGGTIQSSGSSVLDFGRYATFDRVVLDTESSNARFIRVEESITLNEDIEITAGSVGFGNLGGFYVGDDSGDGIAHLGGDGTVTFRTNPNPSIGYGVSISADHSETLEIGTDLTILQDAEGILLLLGGVESSLVNTGTLDFQHGDTRIDGQWTNQGTLRLSNLANVLLLGEYTTADLLSIDYQGGDLRIAGTLDNTGSILLKDASTPWLVVNQVSHSAHPGDGVSIIGGRIETADGQSFRNVASLDGVTLAGDVWLGDRNNGTIFNGLVFDGGVLHVVDPDNSLYSGLFSGVGTIQFDAGRFNPPVLRFSSTDNPFGSDISIQTGNSDGTVGESSYTWTNQAALRSFNPGLDLRVEGDVTHTGTAFVEDGGSITFAALTNHGTLLAEGGGILRLEDGWTNTTGQIELNDGGVLAVEAWSATPGTIILNEGVVRVEFDTDLAGLAVFPQMAGSFIDVAQELDLGGGTLDLDTLTSTLRLDGGTLRDGTVVGSIPLQIPNALSPASTLDAVLVQTDVQLGDTGTTHLRGTSGFVGSTITGDGELRIGTGQAATFDATSIESSVVVDRGATLSISNGLTLDGQVRPGAGSGATPRLLFTGPQTLAGEGEISANTPAGLKIDFAGNLAVGPGVTLSATGGTLALAGAGNTLDTQGRVSVGVARNASVSAGGWVNHGLVEVNASGLLAVAADTFTNHGGLELRGATLFASGVDLRNEAGALLAGRGTVNLGAGGVLHQAGDLEVLQATNTRLLIIGGLGSQASATTRITFDNNHADTLAYLQTTEAAALDGGLVLDAESLITVEAGDTQTLVLGDTLSGEFAEVSGLQIIPGLRWHLDYQADRLVAEARLAGDADNDGRVGATDLDLILANWGGAATAGDANVGEFSGDGTIGRDDLQVVLDHWGLAIPEGSSNVPEPGTLALLSIMLFAPRRRRQSA